MDTHSHIAPEPIEAPLPVTVRDLRKYRRIESDVCQELALELQDSGCQIDAGQVAWILEVGQFQIRRRVEREGNRRNDWWCRCGLSHLPTVPDCPSCDDTREGK